MHPVKSTGVSTPGNLRIDLCASLSSTAEKCLSELIVAGRCRCEDRARLHHVSGQLNTSGCPRATNDNRALGGEISDRVGNVVANRPRNAAVADIGIEDDDSV